MKLWNWFILLPGILFAAGEPLGKLPEEITVSGNKVQTLKIDLPIPERMHWNQYRGLSFKVKGDGSQEWGRIGIGYSSSGWLYTYSFPLNSSEWVDCTAAWGDFIAAGIHNSYSMNHPYAPKPAEFDWVILRGKGTWSIREIRLIEEVTPEYVAGIHHSLLPAELKERITRGESLRVASFGLNSLAGTLPWNIQAKGDCNLSITDLTCSVREDFRQQAFDLVLVSLGRRECIQAVAPQVFQQKLLDWIARGTAFSRGKTAFLFLSPLAKNDAWTERGRKAYGDILRETAENPFGYLEIGLSEDGFKSAFELTEEGRKCVAEHIIKYLQ